jgi:hypothetical protein
MAQTDLQDALMEWLLDAPVSRKHLVQELERLLENVAARRDAEWDDNCGAPPRIHIHETILAALKDENDG